MLDLIFSVSLGLIVIALAVWGGIVSAQSLPAGKKKNFHVGAFLGMGLVAFLLTIAVGVRGFYAQKYATAQQSQLMSTNQEMKKRLDQANAKLDKSRDEQMYMSGQINGLSMSVGKMDTDGNNGTAALANALRLIGEEPNHAAGVEPPAIERMTNRQLKAKVIEFANDMRVAASEYGIGLDRLISQQMVISKETRTKDGSPHGPLQNQAWIQMLASQRNFENRESLEISQKYLGAATQYHEELVRRLGPQKPLTGLDSMFVLWARSPEYSERNLTTTATVLELMARKLPN